MRDLDPLRLANRRRLRHAACAREKSGNSCAGRDKTHQQELGCHVVLQYKSCIKHRAAARMSGAEKSRGRARSQAEALASSWPATRKTALARTRRCSSTVM